jgi:hypothetical protein
VDEKNTVLLGFQTSYLLQSMGDDGDDGDEKNRAGSQMSKYLQQWYKGER